MIELYLLVGVLFGCEVFYHNFKDFDGSEMRVVTGALLGLVAVSIFWPGYAACLIKNSNGYDKLKTDYLPKLKSWIDRKRGKEAA